MIHIEILVEETSAEAALSNLVPKILGQEISFKIHPFQGKNDLLKNLPSRLNGYRKWLPDYCRIVVIIDLDRGNCLRLKESLDEVAYNAGLITKTQSNSTGFFQVLNRLAIEELEAWFFGDPDAVRQAYPGVSRNLERKATYREPDAIRGGTWEALERVLQRAGYFRGGLAKKTAAENISRFMDPNRNRSRSFQVFSEGMVALKKTLIEY